MNFNRRKFLSITAMGGSLSVLDSLSLFAKPTFTEMPPNNFKLLILATNWGFNGTWDEFSQKIKEEGYDGAEVWYMDNVDERNNFLNAFKKHNLQFGFLVGSGESNYDKHLQQFKTNLESALKLKPLYINCHSGKDYFSFDQNQAFIEATIQASGISGIPVYHETHRSRILYSAPVTRQFLEKNPRLQLTLDISHWCCVHESLLEDQSETVSLALKKTGHIHARIGHQEGPQVNDPRAPEWKRTVEAHFAWWDKVVSEKKTQGQVMTILTEFGPVSYMPALPYSQKPVADQWEINRHMLNVLRSRYGR